MKSGPMEPTDYNNIRQGFQYVYFYLEQVKDFMYKFNISEHLTFQRKFNDTILYLDLADINAKNWNLYERAPTELLANITLATSLN